MLGRQEGRFCCRKALTDNALLQILSANVIGPCQMTVNSDTEVFGR